MKITDFERLIVLAKQSNPDLLSEDRRFYLQVARKNGVPASTYYTRVRNGIPPQDAARDEKQYHRSRKKGQDALDSESAGLPTRAISQWKYRHPDLDWPNDRIVAQIKANQNQSDVARRQGQDGKNGWRSKFGRMIYE